MSKLEMDLQGDALSLMAEENISYEDGLHDQELSYVARIECPFADFNFRGTFLSKVIF